MALAASILLAITEASGQCPIGAGSSGFMGKVEIVYSGSATDPASPKVMFAIVRGDGLDSNGVSGGAVDPQMLGRNVSGGSTIGGKFVGIDADSGIVWFGDTRLVVPKGRNMLLVELDPAIRPRVVGSAYLDVAGGLGPCGLEAGRAFEDRLLAKMIELPAVWSFFRDPLDWLCVSRERHVFQFDRNTVAAYGYAREGDRFRVQSLAVIRGPADQIKRYLKSIAYRDADGSFSVGGQRFQTAPRNALMIEIDSGGHARQAGIAPMREMLTDSFACEGPQFVSAGADSLGKALYRVPALEEFLRKPIRR